MVVELTIGPLECGERSRDEKLWPHLSWSLKLIEIYEYMHILGSYCCDTYISRSQLCFTVDV